MFDNSAELEAMASRTSATFLWSNGLRLSVASEITAQFMIV